MSEGHNMNATTLQIAYPHTIQGVISRADIYECADALDTDTALDYVSKVSRSIRKNGSSGCFHLNANGKYNLCVFIESDGSVELMYQIPSTNSTVNQSGTSRNQMRRVSQIIIEHFEGTQSFDEQIEAIYGTN